MQSKKRMRLGDLLIKQGILTQIQLEAAIEKQKITGEKLGIILIDMGITNELEIAKALQRQLGYQIVQLSGLRISPEILKLVPDVGFLKKNIMLPFDYLPAKSGLYVAMADPMNIMAIDDLALVTNMRIRPVIGTTKDIMAAIDKYYGLQENAAVIDAYTRENFITKNVQKENSIDKVASTPIVSLIKSMIEQAVRMRASDIHIEPLESNLRVRFRIDGELLETATYPIAMFAAIVARVKNIAGMDLSEKRKPQEGKMTQVVDRQAYEIRVLTLPTYDGEKLVLRMNTKKLHTAKKEELGFRKEDLKTFERMLKNPQGLILVTGPMNSGKSTTLYTMLSELNTEKVNIVTIEEPVKASIEGVNQIEIGAKSDMDFENTLRAVLRQDSDVIMLSEIEGEETTNMAVNAAITGSLVMGAMHTGNAAATIMRLIDLGVEPYLIADCIIGIVAQRLVKKLCDCKKKRIATLDEKRQLGVALDADIEICEPCGCEKCNNTGYFGRTGIYEIMEMTGALHEVIIKDTDVRLIQKTAVDAGMKTIRESAEKLVLEGVTGIEEMKRVSYATQHFGRTLYGM